MKKKRERKKLKKKRFSIGGQEDVGLFAQWHGIRVMSYDIRHMALLSPSVKGLNQLLDCFSRFCDKWDICHNSTKSKLMYFGKVCENLYRPSLDGGILDL